MNYHIYLESNEVLSGDIFLALLALLFILLVLSYIIKIIYSRLRENEVMKYEFVTIIAHKFRTPLTQMKWLLETNREVEQDPYKKENFEKIYATNEKLINLTNTLVEATDANNKSSSLYTFKRVNLCDIVHKLSLSLKDRFHEKNIFYATDCSHPEIYVDVDEPRMEFVIQTLIENAIAYSPVGRGVEIIAVKERNKASLQIIDHGIGASPKDLERVFSKFFRSEDAQAMDTEGFGIGLYFARSIVKRHKGKIEAYSEGKNKGMTFTITLPLSKN